jgi:hypothetical protein
MRLSALRLPQLFRGHGNRGVRQQTRAQVRRENTASLQAQAKQSSSGAQVLDCFVCASRKDETMAPRERICLGMRIANGEELTATRHSRS